jgi:hypothetical protein
MEYIKYPMINKLAEEYDNTNENTHYWSDGRKVYFRTHEIKGVDIETFEQYFCCWAKDKNYCYDGFIRIKDADVNTFQALNFTYAKDKSNVFTVGGKIKNVDARTFEICDNGKHSLGKERMDNKIYELYVPYGFGRDKNNVYYYNFNGKPKIVKNALPKTFVSLDDGCFGYDENSVFCEIWKLNKANPKTWKLIKRGYYYSKDKVVYYFNRIIKMADVETFEVIETSEELGWAMQLAKDKDNYYYTDIIITKEEFEEYKNK